MKKSWYWFGFLVLLLCVVGLAIWMAGLGGDSRGGLDRSEGPDSLESSKRSGGTVAAPVEDQESRGVAAPDSPASSGSASPSGGAASPVRAPAWLVPAQASVDPGALTAYFDASEFAGDSAEEHVATLDEVFRRFQKVYGENPVGSHQEVVAALTGANPKKVAFIDPAKLKAGAFLDRWGTPFVFHAQSGTEMEVRSAGPDQQPFTADDIVGIHGP